MGHLLNYHHYLSPYRIEEYSCKKHHLVEIKKKKKYLISIEGIKNTMETISPKQLCHILFTSVLFCLNFFNIILFYREKKKIPPIKRQNDCNLMLKNITSLCIRMLIMLTCYHFLYTFTYSKLIH